MKYKFVILNHSYQAFMTSLFHQPITRQRTMYCRRIQTGYISSYLYSMDFDPVITSNLIDMFGQVAHLRSVNKPSCTILFQLRFVLCSCVITAVLFGFFFRVCESSYYHLASRGEQQWQHKHRTRRQLQQASHQECNSQSWTSPPCKLSSIFFLYLSFQKLFKNNQVT